MQTGYSCTEGGFISFQCSEGHLHVNDDWVILEPVDANGKPVPPGTLSDKLYLTNLANFVQPVIRYEVTVPDRMAIRFNQAGQAIAWADKSFSSLLYMPLTQLFMAVVLIFTYYMINRSRPQIDPANREKTMEQNIRFRYRWSVFTVVLGLLLILLLALVQLSMMGIVSSGLAVTASFVLMVVIILAVILLSVLSGQSGNRIKVGTSTEGSPIIRDDDAYWKLGMWYYNPDDPSIFIEKRVGIGWTVNWGRPMAWVVIAGIIILIAGFSIISTSMVK